MVLGPGGPGRVGRCQAFPFKKGNKVHVGDDSRGSRLVFFLAGALSSAG